MTGTGDCYPTAYRLATERPGYRLCHGDVVGQGGIDGVVHGHAWVEMTETRAVPLHDWSGTVDVSVTVAIDRSNGNDITMPAEMYRKLGRAANVVEYDADEAMVMALRTGHYGPWHD